MIILLIAALLSLLPVLVQAAVWLSLKKPPPRPVQEPLSVIVAAHNEEGRIEALLDALSFVEYEAPWEVILVLDRCTDKTAEIAAGFRHQLPNLRLIRVKEVPQGTSPKKHALAVAIRASSHDRLIFTDADCEMGPHWLQEVDRHFTPSKELLIGLGPYKRKRGLLNLMVSYETFLTGTQYIAMAALGMPYMAVGRNLGYRRVFYDKANEFRVFSKRLSGDDDLPVNHFGKRGRIAIMTSRSSLTWSQPPGSFSEWIRQKLRHFSAAPAYTLRSRILLTLLHGCHSIFYLSLIGAFFLLPETGWVAGVWLGRSLAAMAFWSTLPAPWRDSRLLIWFPVLDLLYFFFYILAGPVGILSRPSWKKTSAE